MAHNQPDFPFPRPQPVTLATPPRGAPYVFQSVPTITACTRCGLKTCTKVFGCDGLRPTFATPTPPSSPAAPSFVPVAAEGGVYCDHCGQRPIVGPRLKCLNCDDYDLCVACNSLNNEAIKLGRAAIHSPDHVFVQLRPRAAPQCPTSITGF
jgi:hypothetical protein